MNKFSVFFKSGGGDSIKGVDKYWQKTTKVLDILSQKEYAESMDQFHIALRVDGDFISFGDPEGCSHLKYFKQKKLIANTISFGKKIAKDEAVLKDFMKKNLLLAFEQMVNKLKKEKVAIKDEELLKDLQQLVEENF